MSRKRASDRSGSRSPAAPSVRDARLAISADAFPHVSTFCRGYLHEDFERVYGTATAALEACLRDLTPAERLELAAEADRLRVALAKASLSMVRQVFASTFHARWRPLLQGDVAMLLERMRTAGPDPPSARST